MNKLAYAAIGLSLLTACATTPPLPPRTADDRAGRSVAVTPASR